MTILISTVKMLEMSALVIRGQGYLGANSYGGGEYYDGYGNNNKQGKGFDDCVINNNNTNTNIAISEGNQTIPPEPEPTTATLTVKKQVFGCNNITQFGEMSCGNLQNNSPLWISCDNPAISNTIFCTALNENSFDIEVLNASNNQQIAQFEGSAVGTTIPNLQPGTYTVNEIEQPEGNNVNQLGDSQTTNVRCANQGFPDGGNFFNTTVPRVAYEICFEYEDEQGNDCSTITLAAGEERTCTVKNYIRGAGPPN
jgi:hypothetical protein